MLRALVFLLVLSCSLPAAAPALEAHLVTDAPGVRAISTDDALGLSNSVTAFLLRKSDGALLGIWNKENRNLVAPAPAVPLWAIEQTSSPAEKPKLTGPAKDEQVVFPTALTTIGKDGIVTLTSTSGGHTVSISAALSAGSPFIH